MSNIIKMQNGGVRPTWFLLQRVQGNYATTAKCIRTCRIRQSNQIRRCFSTSKLRINGSISILPKIGYTGDQTNVLSRLSTPISVRTYSQTERPRAQSTIDEEEVDKFRALSDTWWKESGEFQALHTMNDLRVPLIRDAVLSSQAYQGEDGHDSSQFDRNVAVPLKGNLILDVGCGGGILTEPLARLGATVIGIDAVEENIIMAQTHASHDPSIRGRLKYIHGTAEDLAGTESGMFDVVVASEVLEHVNDVEQLVATCVDLAKPGGSIIFTTINKTWLSYMLAVVGAEDILRVVPHGTHNWEKFIPPEELESMLEQYGCDVKLVEGMLYNPVTHHWSWTDIQKCNYAIHAIKSEDNSAQQNIEPEEEEIELKSTRHER